MSEATLLLERSSLDRPEGTDLAEMWLELPREAEACLGYSVLREKQQRYRLWSLLDELGIRPFTEDSVERYQQRLSDEATPKHPTLDRLMSAAEKASIAAVLVSVGPTLLGWIISWKISVAFLAVLIITAIIGGVINGRTIRSEPEWRTVPLEGYREPVPEFALQMAVQISQKLPDASFGVCQLVQNERVLDPFLVVEYGPERHYIAVWSEPQFGLESAA